MDHPLPAEQSAALPFRFCRNGECEVLLVTSLRRRRWILPKGNVDPSLTPALSAAKEAIEEAGVAGMITSTDVGSYIHDKRGVDGSSDPTSVRVFPLAVSAEAEDWPERSKRERRWFPIQAAVRMVDEPELELILALFARDQHARAVAVPQRLVTPT